jgi:membrane-associated phospholipid phosphatase
MDTRTIYWFMNIGFILILLLDYRKDLDAPPSWKSFLPIGLPLLVLIGVLLEYAGPFWSWFLSKWLVEGHLWHWDDLFRSIPYNDGSIFRSYQPEPFTWFMRWVYDYGFILAWGAALLRSFLLRSTTKMVRYTLASHMLQLPIIVPFYTAILLNEVWYVEGTPDGMARNLEGTELLYTVRNCFPSMHTSVSFAMLLLAWRERGSLYRWGMVTYCALVIYSTLYLTIHWVLDVIAGIALGGFTVWLVDRLLDITRRRSMMRHRSRAEQESA